MGFIKHGRDIVGRAGIPKGMTLRQAKELTNARKLQEIRLGYRGNNRRLKPFDFGDLATYTDPPRPGRKKVRPDKVPFDRETWLAKVRAGIKKREENKTAAAQMVARAEHAVIVEAIANLPRDVTEGRVQVLAKKMDEEMKQEIRAARRKLVLNAQRYVEVHIQATEKALQEENHKAAMDGAQWALESIGEGAERVIERAKAASAPDQSKVMIGINLGGIPAQPLPAIEAHVESQD